jgi:hypothetical protein
MPLRQIVPKFSQHAACILSCVRCSNPVVKMDLNLAPTRMTEFCQTLDQIPIILLGRIKMSVDERAPIFVAVSVGELRILLTPLLKPLLLLNVRCAGLAIAGNVCRFEMIGNGNDEVYFP